MSQHWQDGEICELLKSQAQQESTLTTTGLASMLRSVVYFPEFCRTSSTQCQRDDVSRRTVGKVEAMKLASGEQTPLVLVSGTAH